MHEWKMKINRECFNCRSSINIEIYYEADQRIFNIMVR